MERQIGRVVDQIARAVPRGPDLRLVALGGDVRFAAAQILSGFDSQAVARAIVAFFADYDLLLTPVLASRPLPIGELHGCGEDPLADLRRSGTFAPFTATHHAITGHAIEVDGDRATIHAHVRAEHWLADGRRWLVVGPSMPCRCRPVVLPWGPAVARPSFFHRAYCRPPVVPPSGPAVARPSFFHRGGPSRARRRSPGLLRLCPCSRRS